ncbi:farnesol dehydrogenase-like [Phymastichus coffea]|uniref:farnesol dehydrogenase-like n=1 Tax=Phymastichus coffea TaxID=108790 RepID=UPI00273A9EA9|nr:farnesol dehydrogenase-like [Phymastichus coffea]
MERWFGKVAVVTGASAGIGLETSKALVQNGMIVVGLSRRTDKMQNGMKAVPGPGKFYAKACDVTNESEVKQVFDWVEKNFQSVHILVNNAGCAKYSTIEDMKSEDLKHIIDVNVVGLLHCTRHAISIMKKNKHDAHIININSNAGHKVPSIKGLNVYPATKYAVTALSETLINEMSGEKIRVTSISPGVVKTDFFDVANMDPSFLKERPALNPEDVANSIVHVISAPQHVQITELTIKPLGQLH